MLVEVIEFIISSNLEQKRINESSFKQNAAEKAQVGSNVIRSFLKKTLRRNIKNH